MDSIGTDSVSSAADISVGADVSPSGADLQVPNLYVVGVLLLTGGFTLVTGIWARISPESFADFAQFPNHEHFLHDIGAFQIGLALMLLLAIIWRDVVVLALTAFFVGNTIHTVNHIVDLHLGGTASQAWALGSLSLLTAIALWMRLRQLGYVVGRITASPAHPSVASFAQQKTVLLTTYRRNGTGVPTPVSIAVDGERAFVRSFEKAGKTRRIANYSVVEVAPCRTRGQVTGPVVGGHARQLDGEEASAASRLIRHKYPLVHGVVIPFSHRAFRSKTGRTVHFELTL